MTDLPILSAQLDRVLSFFSRVETKSSFLLGTNIGIIAIGFYNLDYQDISTWYVMTPLIVAVSLVGFSTMSLYRAAYPHLDGGEESPIYFRSIATRTEARYIDLFLGATEDQIKRDMLGQIWRNSVILIEKFNLIQSAYRYTVFSILPWSIFLFASSYVHARVIIMK